MTTVQYIEEEGQRRFAVIPIGDYEAMLDALDEVAGQKVFDAAAGEESFPAAVADRLIAGESPLRVFREYREVSLRTLAEKAGISAAYLSEIETGKRDGTVATMQKLATALGLSLDDIV
jgi:DNA-binding XRE family transcriptional regulator